MSVDKFFLKQNILMEPLINQWYAWSYLIPPSTSAMFMANSHLKIMQSFVSNPQTHISALKNPALIGGPFINYDAGRAGEVKALMENTVRKQAKLLELAQAIKLMNETLVNEAGGMSLQPIYEKMPEPLRGYVEIAYDLNNYPSLRFIERLLYKSDYYDRSAQSLALSLIEKDDRPFVFSTPRLSDRGVLFLNTPFALEQVDELFKMKTVPQPLGKIEEALGVSSDNAELFPSFFTTDEPERPARYTGDGISVRYFGHACVLVESKKTSVLFDPVISYKVSSAVERYTFADLPERINFIVITHNHQDHCMFETLLQLRHKTDAVVLPKGGGGTLSDPSLKLALEQVGFKNVIEIDEMESLAVEGGAIVSLPFFGEHADLNIRTKSAFVVTLAGKSVMCLADSNNLSEWLYKEVKKEIGQVDVIFLGMECDGAPLSWLYGPLLTRAVSRKVDQSRRLDGSDSTKALQIVDLFKPQQAYVYAMGLEPWLTHLTSIRYTDASRPIVESSKFVDACRARGITSERLFGKRQFHLQ